MAEVSLHKLNKKFDLSHVVKDVDLQIRDKEFMVFVGPSGCGKTTTLRMIAGLEEASAGDILIGGEVVNDVPPKDRDIAMVFQNYALYPHMSVASNLAFGLKMRKFEKAEIEKRIKNAASILGIESLLQRKPRQLSGGQRQRVAMGRAIVREPAAFLFDEPLSNLDAALRSRTRVELARLHQQVQATMIFVTHDQVEAMTMATRIVVMNHGRIEQVGTPIEVYRAPATRFVAGFIGTPAMNFLPAAVIGERNGGAVVRVASTEVETNVRAALLPREGTVELGVRAEHVNAIGMGAPSAAGAMPAKAEVVERLGDRTLVHARLGDGSNLVYEDSGDSAVKVGDAVNLSIPRAFVHLFDAQGRACRAA